MGTVQSTYATSLTAAYAGALANQSPQRLVSRQIETAAVAFGKALKPGSAADLAVAATGASDTFVGITVRTNDQPGEEYAVDASALVLLQGDIWVVALDGIAADSAAYMSVASPYKFTDTSASFVCASCKGNRR